MDLLEPVFVTQLIIGGLLTGALYALLACGLNLVFGVMRVINIAHAELMIMGSFIALVLFKAVGLHPLVGLLVVIPVMFGFGYLTQRVLIERVVGAPELMSLLVTYGLSIVLMNAGLMIFSSSYRSVPVLQGALLIGDFVISKPRGVAGLVAIAVTLGVYAFLERSRLGKAVRAVAEHPEVATICGIDVRRIRMFTFGLSAAMAATAGVMLSMIYSFSPETGADFIVKCFAIIIIGGMGSFLGALYGGLLLGVAEALVGGFVSTHWAAAVAYLLLVAVLLVRPTGLKGAADVR
ncbi:MAG: branched-chain amino acid ABC transporter permease [Gammaproteobacteria bacterium]|nr:branched-chain amino acid ABC transporter permease [Gammaproteobacteria bacterium]